MKAKEIPLLEFDESEGKARPDHYVSTPKNLPERCVLGFSKSSVNAIAEKYGAPVVCEMPSCTVNLPIYEVNLDGVKIALMCGFIGAANAANQIHELYAAGVRKIVACGSAGTLTPQPLGALIIPDSAVRDEGASFHYAPPSYEMQADKTIVKHIEKTLTKLGLPHVTGKTWTTEAFYRETENKIALRRSQGCLTVEMECSAMIATSQFLGVKFGQILYCGDDLSGEGYDTRDFTHATDVRRNLIEYALACVKEL
ncbi:MAG: nucleoside phosphorylase [Clostridiales bacterium]|nr:nucleoside phosphorylase [Clostridiales bacterium]